MAVQLDSNGKDDIKTQFVTREGTYRLMTLSEYSRPNRVGYTNTQGSSQVRVSLVSLPPGPPGSDNNSGGDRICFNFGKELYVYAYKGVKKAADLNKPVDKKLYKGTSPSCHDFNAAGAAPDGAPLLVGFSTGQIQLVQPGRREPGRLFNEERLIDKTRVTCLRWVPGSPSLFLSAHTSGHLYLYNEELPCAPSAPHYQSFKSGDGYSIQTCKTKTTRNPLYRWAIGSDNCCINEFCFSPCGANLAVVSQDGFLRVFHYDTMELIGIARSYFGGFLCVCWSPDGKYIVVGGEDDLVTVWSVLERRVVARGQGHRSWVSVVAFDPYTTSYSQWDGPDFSDDENAGNDMYNSFQDATSDNGTNVQDTGTVPNDCRSRRSSKRDSTSFDCKQATSYRLGSVSQDTQLCLWDITEDVLRQPVGIRNRLSSHDPGPTGNGGVKCESGDNVTAASSDCKKVDCKPGCSKDTNQGSMGRNSLVKNPGKSSKTETAGCNASGGSNKPSLEVIVTNKNSLSIKNTNKSNSINNVVNIQVGNCVRDTTNSDKCNTSTKSENSSSAMNTLTQRLSNFSFGDRKSSNSDSNTTHKRNFSLTSKINSSNSNSDNKNHSSVSHSSGSVLSSKLAKVGPSDPLRLIGTPACPRFDECPVLEPLICKKIAHERLTALIFREDCFLTACQDGFVYTWARPGHMGISQHAPPSPTTQGGTVV